MKATDFLVLAVLADGPRHGYALAQAIAERSGQRTRIRPGDLYRVLYRMQNAGLIDASAPPRGEGDGRRAYYRITPAGRKAARAEAQQLRTVCDGVLGRTS
jgi:DNA-binding PadR family transcriptional regulator